MYSFETFKLTIHDWVVFSNCPVCPKYSEMQWVFILCLFCDVCLFLFETSYCEGIVFIVHSCT